MNRHWRLPIGILLILIGALWTLQGLGYVGGSMMTRVAVWAVIGPVVTLVGVLFVLRSRNPPD
ncbi:hypothetical protein OO014_08680 [Intrasporangium calvum]|uniref:Integral membrane protein n=1 Tax=Intrasporangium calvum TaxID=53358 RepID=A0ABT5GHL9_9MICO|nr:hypothetical protein [Intrasporangium calvum]MDC5697330.1 hypothetical protein [Intrasporangium calvum]